MITNYAATYEAIISRINQGYAIQVTTHTKSFILKNASQFKVNASGVYIQRGKKWDCINFCKIDVIKFQ